ncbi:ETS translocation variant 1 [Stylophora pistillata]|uniref:ETS translocation variant 1 n=1 Tax=Stylophora pistillata TaxID=50429 RepID=A0A2B4SL68_STYPI|nr:ETS translocation variant 1 [Stylophora pistillata]
MKVQGKETDLEIEVTDESNNGGKHSQVKKHRRKNVIHLWEFLLELLANDNLCTIICWSRRELNEFQLKRPEEVARRWGLLRKRKGMNYKKLSRALRFYYGKGIIQKVPGERFTYKFDKLPYRYHPEVSQPRNQDCKLTSWDQEQKQILSDKSTSYLSKESVFSSSYEQSTLSRAHIPLGKSIIPSLIPSAAQSTQISQVSVQQLSPQICILSKITLKATAPSLFPERDLLNCTTKSIPVSVIKRSPPIHYADE